MRRSSKVCGSLFILLALTGSATAATYEGIDCPDSIYTAALAINDRGDIVGTCTDANSDAHGFLLSNGVFQLIDAPRATSGTSAFGINDLGDVVGHYSGGGRAHGFLYRNGHFMPFDVPNSVNTYPRSIDDLGRIVGSYQYFQDGNPGPHRGFIRDSRGFRDIVHPTARETYPSGINVLGQIVGTRITPHYLGHGFALVNGKFRLIEPPAAKAAGALGVNVLGHIVGSWNDDLDCYRCSKAFLFIPWASGRPARYINLKFPGAQETVAYGINTAGQIVGHYWGADGKSHGFIRTP